MTNPHDELRKRLNAYREAKSLYESPDPYDREESRYDAMHVALGRIGYDEALAQALIDEHDRLDEALGLAYPRALQAAADVVRNADATMAYLEPEESEVLAWVDDIANDILELTEEQIEAFDAKVEHEHAEAVAPKPESEDARAWCWRRPGDEVCQGPYATREEAIHEARHGHLEEGPIEVGRCTPPMDALDALGTPDADDMRERVNDILCDEGLYAHAIILDEPAADAALRQWFLRCVGVDGIQWVARDEETVWPDEPEEGGTR